MRGKIFTRTFCASIAGLLLWQSAILAASAEVYPAERRPDNTVYAIAGENNYVLVSLYAENQGKHSLPEISADTKDEFMLTVETPASVEYVGVFDFQGKNAPRQFVAVGESADVTRAGIAYKTRKIKLNRELLMERIVKGKYYYRIYVWFKPPQGAGGTFNWSLDLGETNLAQASNPLHVLPPIDAAKKLPKDFIVYMWSANSNVPDEYATHEAGFYRRLGVTHIGIQFWPGTTDENWKSNYRSVWATTMRKAGLKVIAERGGNYEKEIHGIRPDGYKDIGLAAGSTQACEQLQSEQNAKEYAVVAPYVDGLLWDYEPHGPGKHPGYDDVKTIAAFAKDKGIAEELTPEVLKTKYEKEYYDYRMNLMCDPIRALGKMVRGVKSDSKFYVCQGSSLPVGILLEWKNYDQDVDLHMPMLYPAYAQIYHEQVDAVAEYIGCKKLLPIGSIGWRQGGVRPHPNRIFMEYLSSAVCGTVGYAHWPDISQMDGAVLHGIWRAGTVLAPVEKFFSNGKRFTQFSAVPIPYVERTLQVGARAVDLSQPYWKGYTTARAFALGGETAFALLNFHMEEKAFFRFATDAFPQGGYLVNLEKGVYLSRNGKSFFDAEALKDVVLPVGAMNAEIWVFTADKDGIAGLQTLPEEESRNEFIQRQKDFSAKGASSVDLGKKGDIETAYALVPFNDSEDVCLKVATLSQEVYFSELGGKIWKWTVGETDLVERGSHAQSGIGMDLLWSPSSARWCGDQLRPMRLVKCVNDGKQVELIYEGDMKTGVPGLTLEKTYRISAEKAAIAVTLKMRNETPLPLTVSYWCHNTLAQVGANRELLVKDADGKWQSYPADRGGELVFPRQGLPAAQAEFLFKAHVKTPAGGTVFGDYFADAKLGVKLYMPEDFLQIYRWHSSRPGVASAEWMQEAVEIGAGCVKTIDFGYQAVDKIDQAAFIASMESKQ
jgi:hypothetical protein